MKYRLPLVCVTISGCAGIQSALDTRGPQAESIAEIGMVLIVGGGLIFLLVLAALAYALRARHGAWLEKKGFIIGAGVIFPVVTLTALLIYTFSAAGLLVRAGGSDVLRIEVIGEQWWWRVRYPGEGFVTANEIRIPAGRPVEFVLTTADVIHSFWVPNLAGKIDMIPGRVNRLRMQADQPGIFRGQCAEYCGGPHAKMAFYVVAQEPAAFARWIEAQRQPAAQPGDAFAARGKQLFLENACAVCHAVRGTSARGELGPDLTHVASRTHIGAGILPNNVGTLAGWIASSQGIKPGNRMPDFHHFSGEELRALAVYLGGLH